MYGLVADITPPISLIENTNYVGSGRLWGRHVLYNTHELYLGGNWSSGSPPVGSVEDSSPILYSVINE